MKMNKKIFKNTFHATGDVITHQKNLEYLCEK